MRLDMLCSTHHHFRYKEKILYVGDYENPIGYKGTDVRQRL